MAYVRVDENEPLEKSIKRFKRMVEKRIIREYKRREYFEKPSTLLNRKRKHARKQMKSPEAIQLQRLLIPSWCYRRQL